jgi:hypothetical protein
MGRQRKIKADGESRYSLGGVIGIISVLVTLAAASAGVATWIRDRLCQLEIAPCHAELITIKERSWDLQRRLNRVLLTEKVSFDFSGVTVHEAARSLRDHLGHSITVLSTNTNTSFTRKYHEVPLGRVLYELSRYGEVRLDGVPLDPSALSEFAETPRASRGD